MSKFCSELRQKLVFSGEENQRELSEEILTVGFVHPNTYRRAPGAHQRCLVPSCIVSAV